MDPTELRRLRREFVRRHHPDVGGDPGRFRAGLARLERGLPPWDEEQTLVFYRRPRGLRGLAGMVVRIERRRRRPRPPRVR